MNKLELKKIINSNVFCILPWISRYIGTSGQINTCCVANEKKYSFGSFFSDEVDDFLNSSKIIELRQKILNCRKSEQCRECYRIELNGGKSLRTTYLKKYITDIIEYYQYSSERDFFNDLINGDGSWEKDLFFLDIRPGNLCNLQCRMCSPRLSSQLQREAKKTSRPDLLNGDTEKISCNWLDDPDNFTKIKKIAKKVKRLKITGGEPLINIKVYSLLDFCIENGLAKKMDLHIATNGTNVEKIIEYKNNFKSIKIVLSIDGVEEINEFIRYPSSWKVVNNNINKLILVNDFILEINTVVMIYNAMYILNLLDWLNSLSRQVFVNFTFLRHPQYLSPFMIPLKKREKYVEKILDRLPLYENLHHGTIENVKYLCRRLVEKNHANMRSEDNMKMFFKMNSYFNKTRNQSMPEKLSNSLDSFKLENEY